MRRTVLIAIKARLFYHSAVHASKPRRCRADQKACETGPEVARTTATPLKTDGSKAFKKPPDFGCPKTSVRA